MNDHTTKETSQKIPYGYCHCGCGQKTNLAPNNDRRRSWIKGEPLQYVFGHQHQKNKIEPPNPSGLCMCGCGEKTKIAHLTDRARGWLKGHPILYVFGHNKNHLAPPAPDFCACGCGQRLKKAKSASQQARFISGHNARQPVEKRFWERVNKLSATDCWNWTGSMGSHGYGTLSVDGNPRTTHRLAWELTTGPIPDGMHVLHHCDNRRCCNPSHLFLGTNLDNIQDMVKKGRQSKGASKNAKKGEENVTAVLTAEQVLDIRRRVGNGEHQRDIAKEYGVSQGHVSNLVRRVTWKHI
jgi:hypothetical protein